MSTKIEDSIVIGRRVKYLFQKLSNKYHSPQQTYITPQTVNCYVSPEVRQIKEMLVDLSQSLSENITGSHPSPLPPIILDALAFCREGETLEEQEANNDYELATLLLIAGWDFAKVAIVIARTQEQEDEDLLNADFDYGEKVVRAVFKKDFVREAMEAMSLWKRDQGIPLSEIDPHKLGLSDFY